MIHGTLSSMSIYLMSLLRIPRVVRLRLEQIQRDFLLGGGKLWRGSLILKSGIPSIRTKRRVVWELDVFLLSIGPFYVSGTGALRMKGRLFGRML